MSLNEAEKKIGVEQSLSWKVTATEEAVMWMLASNKNQLEPSSIILSDTPRILRKLEAARFMVLLEVLIIWGTWNKIELLLFNTDTQYFSNLPQAQ